jgi:hypothetical protein
MIIDNSFVRSFTLNGFPIFCSGHYQTIKSRPSSVNSTSTYFQAAWRNIKLNTASTLKICLRWQFLKKYFMYSGLNLKERVGSRRAGVPIKIYVTHR